MTATCEVMPSRRWFPVPLDTVQKVKRVFKVVFGFTLLALGAVMLITPGPGWVAIGLGLALLAAEFVWARRLLNRLKEEGGKLRDTILPPKPQKS
jgi:uncharacterized protein (TIGR02611 family)